MSTVLTDAAAAVSADQVASFEQSFRTNPAYRIAQNAVTQTSVDDIALNRDIVTGVDHSFSTVLDDWSVTNQKRSGRCWLFAGLNLCRHGAMARMNSKSFEFSQNYLLFWDKLEKANYFLEAILETADRPADERTVHWLLGNLLSDGGQWNMFVNLLHKYGAVPKSAMPETESSSNTMRMNALLKEKLREGARTLRHAIAHGASVEEARATKQAFLNILYRMLAIHLGTPPSRFDWQWHDKDRAFQRDGMLTPQEFAAKYITLPIDEYVCLVHDPRDTSPYGKTFTVQYLGNVWEGGITRYLNVDMPLLKDIAMRALADGEPVWFGCDVGKMLRRDSGIWDAQVFDYASVYDTAFTLTKAERLVHHQTQMTHAMLFTGVDVVEGTPRRWRVENSWGEENGQKGFYLMNDSWFDEYLFEIAARKSYLPAALQAALDAPPIVLPAWDPMGSLASDEVRAL
ncbi:MAG: C1 family peptidase [Candidatus Tectomicrobia bacterium]|uniref:Aminopeptidase n=1 Tax=Tectimicrobiota bacterium TaxID=2528274 RepID=A0A937W1A7_UNCTE|nr:C1 family peptidase [Candidatus Tectomicrobia bacterium]